MTDQRRKKRKTKNNSFPTYLKIILIIITVPFLFNAANFYYQRTKLEARKKELIEMINQEEQKKQLYLDELSKVGTPEYYEYLARKYLGYIYPDEKVMVVVDQTNK